MPERPSELWKRMAPETRQLAAAAFWSDTESPEIAAQHAEAVVTLARRLNFRTKSVQALSVERRAKLLAQLGEVSDAIATRALIALHFADRRPLMAAFLDALGIAHDDGLITDEGLTPQVPERLRSAYEAVRLAHPAPDVDLYLRTLAALDGDTWGKLDEIVEAVR